jgi:hypothetical protein
MHGLHGDNRSEASDGQPSFAYTVLVDHSDALKCGAKLNHHMHKQERCVPSDKRLSCFCWMGTIRHNTMHEITEDSS